MDNDNTQASWQSRSIQLAAMAIVANVVKGIWPTINIDVTMQGYVVDLLPIIIAGVTGGAMYFRKMARKIVDRWL